MDTILSINHLPNGDFIVPLTEQMLSCGSWQWQAAASQFLVSEGLVNLLPDFAKNVRQEAQSAEINLSVLKKYVHPLDWPDSPWAILEKISTNPSAMAETLEEIRRLRLMTTDGQWNEFLSVCRSVTDSNGLITLTGSLLEYRRLKSLLEPEMRSRLIQFERNEQFLREAEDLSQIGYWLWDKESDYMVWSEGLYRINGVDPAAGTLSYPEYLDKLVHPEDRQEVAEVVSRSEATGKPCDIQYRLVQPNGREKYVHVRARPELGHNGKLSTWTGSVADITKQKRAAEKLLRSEIMLNEAERISNMGSWEWELTTGVLTWSQGEFRLFGVSMEESPDFDLFLSLVLPAYHDKILAIVDKAITDGQPFEIEYSIRTPDGQEKIIRGKGSPVTNAQGKVIKMYGSDMDVTEQRQSQQKISESEWLLSRNEDVFGYGSWLWDASTGKVRWSKGMWKLFGFSEEEIPEAEKERNSDSAYVLRFVHPDDVPLLKSKEVELFETGNFKAFDHRVTTRTGAERIFQMTGQSAVSGDMSLMIGSVRDVTEKRVLTHSLTKNQTLMREAEKMLNFGSWEYDLIQNTIQWTEGTYELFGYTDPDSRPDTITLALLSSHTRPEDQPEFEQRMQQVLRDKQDYEADFYIIRKDGLLRILHAKVQVVTNESGQVIKLIGSSADVTEQKQLSNHLSKQAQLLQGILDNSQAGIFRLNPVRDASGQITEFAFTHVNHTLAEVANQAPKDIVGTRVSKLFPSYLTNGLFEHYRSIYESSVSKRFEFYYPEDGLNKWYDIMASCHGEELLVTFLDITEAKQSQLAQQRQSELLQTVINNSPTGIVLYRAVRDATGQIIDFIHELSNTTNNRVTGREDLLGSSVLPRYSHNQETGIFDSWVRVVESGQAERMTFPYNAHGINGWFEASFIKQGDGLLFTYLDITALKQYQLELERTNGDLQRANSELNNSNQELEQFAYVASHDLQEPLRKIQTFGNLLVQKSNDVLESDSKLYLSRMIAAARRMQGLIQNLLEFSRVGRKQAPLKKTDMNEVLSNVLSDLSEKIRETQATIQADPLPVLWTESSQMHQLFANLLGNALKFTRPGVPPFIHVGSRMATEQEVKQHALNFNSPYVTIRITDNGIGFDPGYAHQIFAIFQRLHGQSEYEGSGIGLAICRKIVENHNGAVFAESNDIQEGSIFTVLLPVEATDESPEKPVQD